MNALSNIEKLNENNYEFWKVQIKSVLICSDLWEYVDGSLAKPDQKAEAWIKKDAKALALINLALSQNQLSHTRKAATSKEAWDELRKVYESTGPITY